MRDRHVRQIFVGLILAFPALVVWMSPAPVAGVRAPKGVEALVPVGLVEAMLIAGLLGAYRARRGLLAGRASLACAPRERLADAHFVQAPAPSVLKTTMR